MYFLPRSPEESPSSQCPILSESPPFVPLDSDRIIFLFLESPSTRVFLIYHGPLFYKETVQRFSQYEDSGKGHSIQEGSSPILSIPRSVSRTKVTTNVVTNKVIPSKRGVYIQRGCFLSKSLDKDPDVGENQVYLYTVPSNKPPRYKTKGSSRNRLMYLCLSKFEKSDNGLAVDEMSYTTNHHRYVTSLSPTRQDVV